MSTLEYLELHKTVILMWTVREAHIWWPKLVAIYPYLRDNGGAWRIVANCFVGNPSPKISVITTMPDEQTKTK